MANLKTIVIAKDYGKPEENIVLRLTLAQYALFQVLREKDLINDSDYSIIDLDSAGVYEFTEPAPDTELETDEERLREFIRKLST